MRLAIARFAEWLNVVLVCLLSQSFPTPPNAELNGEYLYFCTVSAVLLRGFRSSWFISATHNGQSEAGSITNIEPVGMTASGAQSPQNTFPLSPTQT